MRFLLFVARHASASDVMCQILMAAQQRCHRRRGGVCSSHQPGNSCDLGDCFKPSDSMTNARANEVIASIFKVIFRRQESGNVERILHGVSIWIIR